MSYYTSTNTQDDLLLRNLLSFYETREHMLKIVEIVEGKSRMSLRIVDWFVTNYAKKHDTWYSLQTKTGIMRDIMEPTKFKVYDKYKLQLKAYSKKRFDPFCRWDRISIPCSKDQYMETTIGQLNFFKWAIENRILDYIEQNFEEIERDMNSRNSSAAKKHPGFPDTAKTRKKRQELSVSASKCIKKEMVNIVVRFND
jgi:hypothetical protein